MDVIDRSIDRARIPSEDVDVEDAVDASGGRARRLDGGGVDCGDDTTHTHECIDC